MIEQNTQIETSYFVNAPVYRGWQTGDNMPVMLNRMTGDVYSVIEE